MANNTINHLLRLSVCVLAIAGLAGCGGGGGGDGGGGGSEPSGGNASIGLSCNSPSSTGQSSKHYGFWFPDVQLTGDGQTLAVSLVDADDFTKQPQTFEALGNAYQNEDGDLVGVSSVGVTRTGDYDPPSVDDQLAIVNDLRPSALVYIGKDGEVHQINLRDPDPSSTASLLTEGADIRTICAASILTGSFEDENEDYYLYSVPAGPSGTCDWDDPAKNKAYRLQLGQTSTSPKGDDIPNAQPVGTLADSDSGTLLSIVALDGAGNLSIYDSNYDNGDIILSNVIRARDLYRTVDTEFVEATVRKSGAPLEYWLVRIRIEPTTDTPVHSEVLLDTIDNVLASTADNESFYYALQTSSGYAIYKAPLLGSLLSSELTKLYEVNDKPGTLVSVLTSTDRTAGKGRLVFHEVTGPKADTGRLLWIGKDSTPGGTVPQLLDSNVLKDPPFVVANGYLYYSIKDSANDTRMKITTEDGTAYQDYDHSLLLTYTLPISRPSGVAVPQYVLLAAGYTGSYPPSLQGADLDSFATDVSTVGSCVTFGPLGLTREVTFDKVGFGPIGTGTGYSIDSSGKKIAAKFAFDASDGRFVTIPPTQH